MQESENKVVKKPRRIWYVTGVVVIIAISVSLYLISASGEESTDNAQIDGNIITLKSSVGSYVNNIYFEDNQTVKKGDTLIRLDVTALQAGVEQAKAALANAQSGIKVSGSRAQASQQNAIASSEVAQSEKQEIDAALSTLRRLQEEYDRNTKLLEIKGITAQEYRVSANQLDLAKAAYQQAIQKRQSSVASAKGQQQTAHSDKAQVSTAEALVAQRKAELALAVYELSHAYILAPCDGKVTKRAVQVGNYIAAGQNLCAIIDMNNIWVTANVKETQLKNLQAGQSAKIKIDAYPNLELSGTLVSFGGATGAKFSLIPPDNATGNFVKIVQRIPIRIKLKEENVQAIRTSLYPGLSAEVTINTH